jgi:DNA-binding PucR family transcriptional regulator
MVSGAVAGDDLQSVAGSASQALGRPVAIALPSLGAPVIWPPEASTPEKIRELLQHASAVIGGEPDDTVARPPSIADSVEIRIGHEVVGIVAAVGEGALAVDERAWLEAAAAAAAVTSLMRESQEGDLEGSRHALLRALAAGPTADMATLMGQARKLGFDLGAGAVAVCAQSPSDDEVAVTAHPSVLLSAVGGGRVLGLVPISGGSSDDVIASLTTELEARGMKVGVSAPRRAAAVLHEALREAELLVELASRPDASLATQEETYRLLIGVLLRDPEGLALLRERTIAAVSAYDDEHDTELLATLQAFLAHHGSTTETAEAMSLHRHTVGYRLTRVQEVSGLSPYESDGRERLSLGLKADQILEADKRRAHRE